MSLLSRLFNRNKFSSANYWESRYAQGGNSGEGSYDHFAEYKAQVINDLISEFKLRSAVEYGCGDGNQLKLFQFQEYLGVDVSKTVVRRLNDEYRSNEHYQFLTYEAGMGKAISKQVSMSIDVLYHLTEADVYKAYLADLFASAESMVIIYAWNEDVEQKVNHVLPRKFTRDIQNDFPDWKLDRKLDNPFHPRAKGNLPESPAEFYIYRK